VKAQKEKKPPITHPSDSLSVWSPLVFNNNPLLLAEILAFRAFGSSRETVFYRLIGLGQNSNYNFAINIAVKRLTASGISPGCHSFQRTATSFIPEQTQSL